VARKNCAGGSVANWGKNGADVPSWRWVVNGSKTDDNAGGTGGLGAAHLHGQDSEIRSIDTFALAAGIGFTVTPRPKEVLVLKFTSPE